MKKLMIFILASLFICLAACNGEDVQESGSADGSSAVSETASLTEEDTTSALSEEDAALCYSCAKKYTKGFYEVMGSEAEISEIAVVIEDTEEGRLCYFAVKCTVDGEEKTLYSRTGVEEETPDQSLVHFGEYFYADVLPENLSDPFADGVVLELDKALPSAEG